MLSSAVFIAAVTTGLQILVVSSNPVNEVDFSTILELAQQQVLQKETDKDSANVAKYDSASKDEYNNQHRSLTSHEILELIKESAHDHGSGLQSYQPVYNQLNLVKNKPRYKKKPEVQTFGHYDPYGELNENKLNDDYQYEASVQQEDKLKNNDERYQHNLYNQLALSELLTQNVLGKQNQDKLRKKIKPHNLVGSYDLGNDNPESNGGYSKVYVILNPQAIARSKKKNELNSLLVKILSLTASSLGREETKRIKEQRYKGFPVKTGLLTRRARRRDSRENGDDDDFKPKRPRNQGGGGGGGGGGGRTAIPYIRHRGDIYERDN